MTSSNRYHGTTKAPTLCVPSAQPSKFPLSSPMTDDLSTRSFRTKISASTSDEETSPRSSQHPFGDTESGNSSGQDEFHLERYSETSSRGKEAYRGRGSNVKYEAPPKYREESPESRKKPGLPGLNIQTDFASGPRPTLKNPPKLNQVPVQTVRLQTQEARFRDGSESTTRNAISTKQVVNPGFVSLSDLEGLRNIKNDDKKPRLGGRWNNKFKAHGLGQAPQSISRAKDYQQTSKVVIGITVPEDEVAAHGPIDGDGSAVTQTPMTPSIVVTPADATAEWLHPANESSRSRWPASSIYSLTTPTGYGPDAHAPPVPSVPAQHKQVTDEDRTLSRCSMDSWEADTPRQPRPFSSETIIDDDMEPGQARPASAGSQEGILPSSGNTGRPRSIGWWNLMLSPMLSRAGTNLTKKTASPVEEPPAMPTPLTMQRVLALDEKTPGTDMSPETPRRAGLDCARVSTWSNWTQWEQERELAQGRRDSRDPSMKSCHTPEESPQSEDDERHICGPRRGLAEDYYDTCPTPQLNGQPCCQCSHHGSVGHDRAGPVEGSTDGKDVERGLHSTPPGLSRAMATHSLKGGESHIRSDSESTVIEDDPIVASPNVRKALAKPILKARLAHVVEVASDEEHSEHEKSHAKNAVPEKSTTPPPYSSPPVRRNGPRFVGFPPPQQASLPASPGPISPETQRALHPNGAIPMAQVYQPAPAFIHIHTTYPTDLPPRPTAVPVSLADIENHSEARQNAETRRRRYEREDEVAHKAGGLWRGRGCIPQQGCFGKAGANGRLRRRWYLAITAVLLLIIAGSIVAATQLTRRGDQTPVQSQWLNLTGYPPMPTGIATIGKPELEKSVTACVRPSSVWSCALPREDPGSESPNKAEQPNFRVEIRFRNGTVSANGTQTMGSEVDKREVHLRRLALLRRANDPFTNSLFQPNPAPPSQAEQVFLGNTTDQVQSPFNGEDTPFFITFLGADPSLPDGFNDTKSASKKRVRRQNQSASASIPAPAVLSDGTAAAANLLPEDPRPSSQPVRLYDRGLDTEHYGFYTYFDRNVFVKAAGDSNSSSPSDDQESSSQSSSNGSSVSKQEANLRCTWAQTRFLVQIWTNANFAGKTFESSSNGTTGATNNPGKQDNNDVPGSAGSSSATNFDRPGSFPYPVTITLDRHGGDASRKGVYCYGMDEKQQILVKEKKVVGEIRDTGGNLVNPAPGIFGDQGDGKSDFDPKMGGIDGGSGGCSCEWRNWIGNGKS